MVEQMTKTYTTWQVLKLLEMHKDDEDEWEFEAPHVASTFGCVYSQRASIGNGCACDKWNDDPRPYFRSDWVRTKPVKQKRERTKIGDVTVKERNVTFGNTMAFIELPDGDYELVAVKK
jgi:hypothetical protein